MVKKKTALRQFLNENLKRNLHVSIHYNMSVTFKGVGTCYFDFTLTSGYLNIRCGHRINFIVLGIKYKPMICYLLQIY